ncbi:MAG: MoxR family ATPase [Candidatus Hydrogenedentes bacterium]|nr:MoxR family ATPase [Candidatus Hydrogenedentota bacterium]
MNIHTIYEQLERARTEIQKVIIGQEAVIDQALITLFTNQHALIEGVPGIAKTLLVRTLARVVDCDFNRIQFTPDLMPTDITGTNVFSLKDNGFTLVQGPIFTTFLLADEINRAPAKTQSALLQAMQERTVTIDRDTLPLSPHFTVFATQNPVEYEGTYPLPEAQKDRFLLKINMDYPSADEEHLLAQRSMNDQAPDRVLRSGAVTPIITADMLVAVRAGIEAITVREEILRYAVQVVRSSRTHPSVLVGAGPRATQGLIQACRVQAILNKRDFVTPDDVKSMAHAVLEHRLVLRPEFEIEGLSCGEVVSRLLEDVAVPR